MKSKHKSVGFTVIELLAVLTILLVVAVISITSYSHFRDKTRNLTDIAGLKSVYLALNAYAGDHNARVPNVTENTDDSFDVMQSLSPYLGYSGVIISLDKNYVYGLEERLSNRIPVFSYIWAYDNLFVTFPESASSVDMTYFPVCIPYNTSNRNQMILFAEGRVSNRIR